MSYRGVMKAGFDADVELLIAALEPATAAGAKRFRLLDFTQAEKKAVKFTSGGFAALRHRKLNVVDTRD